MDSNTCMLHRGIKMLSGHFDGECCYSGHFFTTGALLGGEVLTAWTPLVPVLISPAATATHTQARNIPRVGELISALIDKQVSFVCPRRSSG